MENVLHHHGSVRNEPDAGYSDVALDCRQANRALVHVPHSHQVELVRVLLAHVQRHGANPARFQGPAPHADALPAVGLHDARDALPLLDPLIHAPGGAGRGHHPQRTHAHLRLPRQLPRPALQPHLALRLFRLLLLCHLRYQQYAPRCGRALLSRRRRPSPRADLGAAVHDGDVVVHPAGVVPERHRHDLRHPRGAAPRALRRPLQGRCLLHAPALLDADAVGQDPRQAERHYRRGAPQRGQGRAGDRGAQGALPRCDLARAPHAPQRHHWARRGCDWRELRAGRRQGEGAPQHHQAVWPAPPLPRQRHSRRKLP
mmetsp:Transcript_46543/g.110241  ORF Transcript_46543/g.110241 Transcript_46543/m.110241 type:complete len:315 (-) Transcript_46543:1579-2523(-)